MIKNDYRLYDRWTSDLSHYTESLYRLAVEEDLSTIGDRTCQALIPQTATGKASIVSREKGILCGMEAAREVVDLAKNGLCWGPLVLDGATIAPGDRLAVLTGPVRSILETERILLNFIGHLSGVATKTSLFVEKVKGTSARIYDTRKTLPGWRLLDKYAVAKGGGRNHRLGLFDHILIKDNHLAFQRERDLLPADAVRLSRLFLEQEGLNRKEPPVLIEIEVDDLDQLRNALLEKPDIVLLDNMDPETMKTAVAIRNELSPATELEASGGISFETVRAKALAGVDRISIGALTHSASCFDVGLDWE